jgi:predicted amidohydrolase
VFDTPLGRIGLEICYDLRFPEVTRTLALAGADIVAHPTAFPVAARVQTELITVARAAENRIYLLTANRVGKERSGEFCGWSQIVDPFGSRLAEAGATEEALLVADIDLDRARDKDYIVPGEYELYLFGDRRPELYGALVEERQPAAT